MQDTTITRKETELRIAEKLREIQKIMLQYENNSGLLCISVFNDHFQAFQLDSKKDCILDIWEDMRKGETHDLQT